MKGCKKVVPIKKKKEVKYCKAPQAPRRFKSAFIFYTEERHPIIREKLVREEGRGDKTPDVAKLISIEWRNLTPEQRDPFEKMARLDKERFEVEKSMYTGPWKIPAKKRSQKDPAAPKRPMSSFLSFSNAKRADLKRKNPGMTNTEASKVLAILWREAPDEEKREHIEGEAKLREIYKVKIAAWRERTKREEDESRRLREEKALNIIASRGGPDAKKPPVEETGQGMAFAHTFDQMNAAYPVATNPGNEQSQYQDQSLQYQQSNPMYPMGYPNPQVMYGNSHHTYGPPPARGVLYPSQYYGGQPHPWPGRPEYYQHNPPNSSGQSYFPPSSRASDQGGMYDGYAPADQGHHYQSHEIGGDKGSMYSNSQQDQGWTQQVHPHPHALRPDERESDEKQPPSRLPLQENYEYSNYSAGTQMSYSSHAAPFEPPPPPPSEVDHHNMKPSQY